MLLKTRAYGIAWRTGEGYPLSTDETLIALPTDKALIMHGIYVGVQQHCLVCHRLVPE